MCMFCTAVPMMASLSIAARAEWKAKVNQAQVTGEPTPKLINRMGQGAFTAVGTVIAMLLIVFFVGAVLYHTNLLSGTGS